MTERCPDCGSALVATMEEFWKNPNYSCPRDVSRTECNDSSRLELHCAQGTINLLRAKLAETEKLVSLADELCRAAIRCGLHTWQSIPVDNDAKKRAVAFGFAMMAYHSASPTCGWPGDSNNFKAKTLDELRKLEEP